MMLPKAPLDMPSRRWIQRIAQLAIEEHETMYCLQARRALDGHKLGITDITFGCLEDDRIAEALSKRRERLPALSKRRERLPALRLGHGLREHARSERAPLRRVPNPDDIRPPVQTVKSSPVSPPASPRSPRSTLR
jgi:hypothetical protein